MSLMATLVSGMPDFRRKPSSLCNDSVKNEHPRAGHSLQDPFTMFTSLGILPLDTHTHTASSHWPMDNVRDVHINDKPCQVAPSRS